MWWNSIISLELNAARWAGKLPVLGEPMKYQRPKSKIQLDSSHKQIMLKQYFAHYQDVAKSDPEALNIKIPRDIFNPLLDQIGVLLLSYATSAIANNSDIRSFLDKNPPPSALGDLLPDDFRAFCLALNALKQWVSAEQAATDRYLLGGTARNACRQAATTCVVTGQQLTDNMELHHPLRDGRPPIPVNKSAHAELEQQTSSQSDPLYAQLAALKKEGNRSWIMLRRGCRDLSGQLVNHSTEAVGNSSRTFARKAASQTNLSYEELLEWLDEHNLG